MKGTLSSMENQFLKQVLKEETSKLIKKKFTQNSKFDNRSKLSCSIELANNNFHVMQEDMYEDEEESISYPSDISEEEIDI